MKKLVTLLLALTMSLSLVSCGKPAEETPSTPDAPDSGSPSVSTVAKDNDLVLLLPNDIDSFDNCVSSQAMQLNVLPNIYGSLIRLDEKNQPYYFLLESVETPDELTWIFKIYDGLKFSDGSDLTSEDVAYSLQRAKDSTVGKAMFANVATIEVVDELSVKVVTSAPYPLMQLALTNNAALIVSKDYCENEAATDNWTNPPASGPYKVDSRSIGDSIKLIPNEHFTLDEYKPQNTSLTYKVVPEASSRTIMVESGDADAAYNFQTTDYERAQKNDELQICVAPTGTMYYMSMDTQTNEYFSNKLVRQAVNYAIDREACCLVGYNGFAAPLYSYTAPTCTTYVENPHGYTYDPAKAKELLAEAGYPDGFSTTMVVSGETGTAVAEVVQSYLAAVGIKTEIQLVENTSMYVNMAPNGELPLAIATWGTSADPGYFLNRILGEAGMGAYNFAQYENPTTQALLDEAGSILDQDRRNELYTEFLNILAEDAPWCPILNPQGFGLANAELQGTRFSGTRYAFPWEMHYE